MLIRRAANGGAAAARNDALDLARGTYVAVLDSDDLMHPDRLRRLVALAEAKGCDIVADDVLVFHDDTDLPPASLLQGQSERWIEPCAYVRANAMDGAVALGYLKPLFRRSLIEAQGLRYNPRLPIAEDYAFVLELLVAGARFWVSDDLTYFYRKHDRSLSHRLSALALTRMQEADAAFVAPVGLPSDFAAALAQRGRGIATALAFEHLVDALKQRDWRRAARLGLANPRALLRLRQPVLDRWRHFLARLRATPTVSVRPSVCLISRQRIIGDTNGSSVYLLSLCRALVAAGFDVHLVSPSPAVFGRWPALVLRPEMAVFKSVQVRGAWRIGGMIVARDPQIAMRAAMTVLARLAARIGIAVTVPNAAYAIGVPWQRDDFLFVARHARPHADAILADYAFLTQGIPYALRPDAPSAVVMHDLFSSHTRPGGPRPPSLVRIDAAHEMRLLGMAGAIVAIQAEEAAEICRLLPEHRVILAPMAVPAVSAPQPGTALVSLFVGSNTGPNIDGLCWFLDEVWPKVRAVLPAAELMVAGGVVNGVSQRPDGVRFLGHVPDLAPVYRDAAVVVSPLRHGSGLKIKFVEALAHGKATVVTGVTLQGVDEIAGKAAIRADTAESFAEGVIALLSDAPLRAQLSARALQVAREHFSVEACTSGLTQFFADGLSHADATKSLQAVA
jgi:succinoglycan biosynthesis protein ExoO